MCWMTTSKRENKHPNASCALQKNLFILMWWCRRWYGCHSYVMRASNVFEVIALHILNNSRTHEHTRIPWFIHSKMYTSHIKWNKIMANLIWIHSEEIRSWINGLRKRSNGWVLNTAISHYYTFSTQKNCIQRINTACI